MHVLEAYVSLSYYKTSNFNYMNFRVYVEVPPLNINHPAGHLILLLLRWCQPKYNFIV